jgi:hypothetical protein
MSFHHDEDDGTTKMRSDGEQQISQIAPIELKSVKSVSSVVPSSF